LRLVLKKEKRQKNGNKKKQKPIQEVESLIHKAQYKPHDEAVQLLVKSRDLAKYQNQYGFKVHDLHQS
jgi:hypothetical protein